MSWLMLAAGAAMSPVTAEHALPDRYIRVGDLAVAPGHETIVIGRLPSGRDAVLVGQDDARRMVRNRLPALAFALRYDSPVSLVHQRAETAAPLACMATREDLAPGQPILAENVEAIPCSRRAVAPGLGYDADRSTPVARAPIPAGSYLGPLRVPKTAPVASGQAMSLRFVSGPVVVEREVVALQPGFPGSNAFVRTAEGEVISARVARDDE